MTERELILTDLLNCPRFNLYIDPLALNSSQESRLKAIFRRRQSGEPLQYILGSCDFMGLRLKVDGRVFIPRPETELLVDKSLAKIKAQECLKPIKILELGAGSGNIAIALAKFLPNCGITAVEISLEALNLAQLNSQICGVSDKIKFIQADMGEFLKNCSESFDVVISNPPYIARNQLSLLPVDVQREPRIAFDGGDDGLDFYRMIIPRIPELLSRGGFLFLEIGEEQKEALKRIFELYPQYRRIKFCKDYCQKDRFVEAQIW